ncbi:putative PhiRv1 phage protein [Mycobacterium canetti]|uniref:phage terminase small subunit P27 family n=1 Tax=Mycobacterium canetti TaxID=78331 RepID=UPI002D77CAC8|nr:phage terminase small subunit P27 family [Mycobacterium canetti]WRO41619.1 putative PhiRv1 phage protein [Mycobacterium canetti]
MPRAPKPARLKLIEGRSPGRDSGGRKVPEPPGFIRQAPEPPDWLDDEARAEWERVTPGLERLDLLKPEDRAMLATYCETWSTYATAMRQVWAEGITVVTPKSGVTHKNPALAVAEAARMHMLRLAAEFGLTPAAEQRLATMPANTDDSLNPFSPGGR